MKLDRGSFAAWLRERPEYEFTAGDGNACPIAGFLKYKARGCWTVDTGTFGRYGLTSELLPSWARSFVYDVDHLDAAVITGTQALEILDEIQDWTPGEGDE